MAEVQKSCLKKSMSEDLANCDCKDDYKEDSSLNSSIKNWNTIKKRNSILERVDKSLELMNVPKWFEDYYKPLDLIKNRVPFEERPSPWKSSSFSLCDQSNNSPTDNKSVLSKRRAKKDRSDSSVNYSSKLSTTTTTRPSKSAYTDYKKRLYSFLPKKDGSISSLTSCDTDCNSSDSLELWSNFPTDDFEATSSGSAADSSFDSMLQRLNFDSSFDFNDCLKGYNSNCSDTDYSSTKSSAFHSNRKSRSRRTFNYKDYMSLLNKTKSASPNASFFEAAAGEVTAQSRESPVADEIKVLKETGPKVQSLIEALESSMIERGTQLRGGSKKDDRFNCTEGKKIERKVSFKLDDDDDDVLCAGSSDKLAAVPIRSKRERANRSFTTSTPETPAEIFFYEQILEEDELPRGDDNDPFYPQSRVSFYEELLQDLRLKDYFHDLKLNTAFCENDSFENEDYSFLDSGYEGASSSEFGESVCVKNFYV